MPSVRYPGGPPSGKEPDERSEAEDRGASADAEPRTFDASNRQTKEALRAAETMSAKTAEASSAAAKANAEILRTQVETAQQAVRSGFETGMRTLETMTQNFTRACGVASANPDLADQAARNVQAVSQASTALARGAQDAARAWFDLTQKSVRTNLEALGQMSRCRSVQEVVSLQSDLLRRNLQHAIESGDAIARASSQAIGEATDVMRSQTAQGGRTTARA